MKSIKALVIAASAVLLTACGNNNALEAGIQQAERIGDPYESAMVLREAQDNYLVEQAHFWNRIFNRATPEELKSADLLARDYLRKAVLLGDIRALRVIFNRDSYLPALKDVTATIIEQAVKPEASPDALVAAAWLKLDGRFTQQDLQGAFNLLLKAWEADQRPNIARLLRAVFVMMEDAPNAYLWNLRCLYACSWPDTSLKDDLTPEEKLHIQKKALEPKVFLIAPSPLKLAES